MQQLTSVVVNGVGEFFVGVDGGVHVGDAGLGQHFRSGLGGEPTTPVRCLVEPTCTECKERIIG